MSGAEGAFQTIEQQTWHQETGSSELDIIEDDEGHGDGFGQDGRGVGVVDPGAAVPHLPLRGRDLLPGHSGQHRSTRRGGALHQGPTAEVNLSKHGRHTRR